MTRIVTETITEEGQGMVVTSVVTEVEEVVVTATPEPVEEVSMVAPDPNTFVQMTFAISALWTRRWPRHGQQHTHPEHL